MLRIDPQSHFYKRLVYSHCYFYFIHFNTVVIVNSIFLCEFIPHRLPISTRMQVEVCDLR